jgi:hypothetical protein
VPDLEGVVRQILFDLQSLIDEMLARQRREQEWASLVRELREGRTYDPRANGVGP